LDLSVEIQAALIFTLAHSMNSMNHPTVYQNIQTFKNNVCKSQNLLICKSSIDYCEVQETLWLNITTSSLYSPTLLLFSNAFTHFTFNIRAISREEPFQ
jgi:hypothetical protein